jgi:SNF2 family DNA or RNA helicase
MISLSSKNDILQIEPIDNIGKESLAQPLHRIFLRGEFSGTLIRDSSIWLIPWSPDKGEELKTLCDYFDSYEIDFKLDDECQGVIRLISKQREDFKRKFSAGRKARSNLPKRYFSDLLNTLSSCGFKRRLTEPQLHALYHLRTVQNGANFSVPGSGKTSIVLAYYCLLKHEGIVDSILVIGPASSFEPWEHEFIECFNVPAISTRIAGNPRKTRLGIYFSSKQYDLVLTTYHTAARDIKDTIRFISHSRFILVLDESHYIKRPQGGKLSNAVLRMSDFAIRKVILTGTPMPNGLADLWSQFTFLWNRILPLGNAETYLVRLQNSKPKTMLTEIHKNIYPLFYRITKADLHLPEQRLIVNKCGFSKLQSRIYHGIASQFLLQTKEEHQDRETLREYRRARAIRLLQVASNPTLLLKSCDEFGLTPLNISNQSLKTIIYEYPKLEIPTKFLECYRIVYEIMKSDLKIIIWSSFVHNLSMLAKGLKDFNPVVIHGGVPYSSTDEEEFSREGLLKRFRNDRDCRMLIANPAACAESISLHKVCHNAIYIDRTFNCAHFMQSMDRIHRLGLHNDDITTYYILECSGSIDEIVSDRLKGKMESMNHVLEDPLPGNIEGFWDKRMDGLDDKDLSYVDSHFKKMAKQL